MKKSAILLIALAFFVARVAIAEISYSGGDGTSMEKAVVIKGAAGEDDGVKSEYKWLKKNYPGYRLKKQSLKSADHKHFDAMEITVKDGKAVTIFFDISAFFGK